MPDAIPAVATSGSFGAPLRMRYAAASRLGEPAATAAGDGDFADVARTAALLAAIAEAAANAPAIDEARVAAVRQGIEAGTVRADPWRIALFYSVFEALIG
jgi:anti-sigma28 factor (negative regulator of flagellin synthesis)